MIAQTYCGKEFDLVFGAMAPRECGEDGIPCRDCLREYVAKLETRNAELEGELSVARMAAMEYESALRKLEAQAEAARINLETAAALDAQAAAQAGGVVVPEPTADEWRLIAENARSADMVDFLAGAAAYGLWLRGKIPNSIPASRVLGEGCLQIIRDALACSKPQMAHYPEPVERHANALKIVEDALRAAKGGAT